MAKILISPAICYLHMRLLQWPTDGRAGTRECDARSAAGVIVVAATQRPSHDIIPVSLRDLFGYRLAFRCTTETSSDIILGHGWHTRGVDASTIDPDDRGVGWLLAEGGTPRRMRCTWLDDAEIVDIARRAAR